MEINDSLCISLFFRDDEMISLRNKGSIFKEYEGLEEFLNNRFDDTRDHAEVLYRIKNSCGRQFCSVCGKPVKFNKAKKKYNTYCSAKCQNSDPLKIKKTFERKVIKYGDGNYNNKDKQKETCLNRYGHTSYTKTSAFIEKCKKTNMKKYGTEWGLQNKEIRKKGEKTKEDLYGDKNYNNREQAEKTTFEKYGVKNTKQSQQAKEKEKETCLQKYGVTSYRKTKECTEKIRKTSLEKYGVENCTQSEKWKEKWYGNNEWSKNRSEKIYETMKNNGSFSKSIPEQAILDFLLNEYGNVIYQYKDDLRYPFKCDFYLPEKDVFIEYNGYWTHGKHPFDANNIEDILILEKWKGKSNKQYKIAIDVWTKMDPMKRKIAKENKLKYIELNYSDYKNPQIIKEKIEAV